MIQRRCVKSVSTVVSWVSYAHPLVVFFPGKGLKVPKLAVDFRLVALPLKGVFIIPFEMQHTYMTLCYDQHWFCHVSLNVITIVLNI